MHSIEIPCATDGRIFVARQPIFGSTLDLDGYELLFRSGLENACCAPDGDQATLEVISAGLVHFGLDRLAGNRRAYINFTENLLKSDAVTMLPAERVVVEVLEDVTPDQGTIDACARLKKMGYLLALDDFTENSHHETLVPLADIIKVDFLAAGPEERERLAGRNWPARTRLLAEKVESVETYRRAQQLGYTLFQGNFFSRPNIVSQRTLSAAEAFCLEALREASRPEMDFDRVANIIKRDVSFSYKLLRFINSAAIGLRMRIHSIQQALVLLGQRETLRWLSLIALRDLGRGKPDELMMTCVVRGRMAELLAGPAGMTDRASDLFLLGLFSAIDALLDRPLHEVAMDLPLSSDVQAALLGQPNRLRQVFDLIFLYENGDWDGFAAMAARLGMAEQVVPSLYIESVAWATEFMPDRSTLELTPQR